MLTWIGLSNIVHSLTTGLQYESESDMYCLFQKITKSEEVNWGKVGIDCKYHILTDKLPKLSLTHWWF